MPGKAQTTGTALELDVDGSGGGGGGTVDQGTGGASAWLVTAVNFDIRDLVFATDKVDVTGSLVAVTGTVVVSNFPATQPVSIAATVATLEVSPAVILNGQKTIAAPGTQAAIAASTACKSVTVKGLSTNTGLVYVGDSGVDSSTGFVLKANESISLDISNLATVFIDVSVMNEGISYLGVN